MNVKDYDVAAYEQPRGKVCAGCRKNSDGALTIRNAQDASIDFCGTHYDEFLREDAPAIRGMARLAPADVDAQFERAVAFAKRLREGKYKPCWDAVLP